MEMPVSESATGARPSATTTWLRLTEFLQWSPAALLLLYVVGYIVANSHYARYEMIKPTLLTGRYLSAGLLYTAFAVGPAAAGFMAVRHAAQRERLREVMIVAMAYVTAIFLYAFLLLTYLLIDPLRWWPWAFIALTALIGASACFGIVQGEVDVPSRQGRALDLASKLATNAIFMMIAAFTFGAGIYPWIGPHFGGAAVRKGEVVLKPEAPEELTRIVGRQPLPFVDIDERFLYVVACFGQAGTHKPEVIMVPLEFLLASGIRSNPDTLLAVPTYIEKHHC